MISYGVAKASDTLFALFAEPTRVNIPWRDIEALFRHYGGKVSTGSGSRVRVVLPGNGLPIRATFHRPHPQKEAHRPLVRSIRKFLEAAGIVP